MIYFPSHGSGRPHHMWCVVIAATMSAAVPSRVNAEPAADATYNAIIDPVKLADVSRSILAAATFEEPEWSWAALAEGVSGKGFDLEKSSRPLTFVAPEVINGSAGAVSWWVRFNDEIQDASIRLFQIDDGGRLYIMYQGAKAWDPRHRHALGHFFFPPAATFIQYASPICPTPEKPDGAWVNITWTWETNRSQVYVDGNMAVERTHDASVAEYGKKFAKLQIGAPGQNAVVDEVRFYNRLLSQADVRGYIAAVRSDALRHQALAVPLTLADKTSGGCTASYRISDHSVVVAADVSSAVQAGEAVTLVVETATGQSVCQNEIAVADPEKLLRIAVPLPAKLEDGVYTVQMRLPAGKPALRATFARQRYPWENNRIGLPDGVPKPWTPIIVKNTESSEADLICAVWGREYAFDRFGLPKSIRVQQPEPTRGPQTADILAGSVAVVAVRDGKQLEWTNGVRKVLKRSPREIVLEASGETTELAMAVHGTLDFDGFYRVNILLTPKALNVDLDQLRIDIPVPDEQALLFNAASDSMRAQKTFLDLSEKGAGILWDSIRAITNDADQSLTTADRPLALWPHTWLGNDDRGIAMMVENTKTWRVENQRPVMDVLRGNGLTTWRLIPVNLPSRVERPIEITFSIQATPVRPRPQGGSGKQLEWYGWGYFDLPVIAKDLEPGDIRSEGRPWYRTPIAQKENRWWRYGCLQSHRVPVDDLVYGDMVKATKNEWENGLYTPSHIDFLLWVFRKWHEKESMDGMYFDNTFPQRANEFGSGLAYVDDTGNLTASYNVFGQREFLKRVQAYFESVGPLPVMMTHVTDCPAVGYLGFADFWLDGENGGYVEHGKQVDHDEGRARFDFIDRWYNPTGMANLRMTLGRQWGPLPRYLYVWYPEPTYAMLGMFDLEHQYEPMGRKPYHEFGRFEEDVRFLPYWMPDRPLTLRAGGRDVFLTGWKRPDRVRVLVSNLSPELRSIGFAIDLDAVGLPRDAVAVDEREGSEVNLVKGEVTGLEVPGHSYRTVILAKPGLYPPLSASVAANFLPSDKTRERDLCDDFSSWNPRWKKQVSEQSWRATGDSPKATNQDVKTDPISVGSGYLRIRNGSGLAHNIRRPFNQDRCAVIVKLREPNGLYEPGFGPGFRLLWAGGEEVGLTAWERGPDHQKDRFHAFGPGLQKWGGLPSSVNWMRIDLDADMIGFKTSTDGATWQELATLPRTDLAGPPVEMVIGHGNERDGLPENHFYSSFVDEVIVSRQ